VPAIDPTLEGAARSTLGKIARHEGAARQRSSRPPSGATRRFAGNSSTCRRSHFPAARRREAIGFVAFLNKCGPAFVERLTAELPIDGGTHWIITV
jgi:hypothetical protein